MQWLVRTDLHPDFAKALRVTNRGAFFSRRARRIVPWIASQSDLLEDDWVVVLEVKLGETAVTY